MTLRKIILTLLFVVGAPALLLGLTVGVYGLAKDYTFDRDVPDATYAAPANRAEARAQDVEHLANFFEVERSFTPTTRARAQAIYDRLTQTAPSMSDAEFELAVAEFVASANNGHTKVREYDRLDRYNRLPIRGHLFEDGYFVIRAHEGYEDLIGARIDRIGDTATSDAFTTVRRFIGGEIGTQDKYAPYILEAPELVHAAGLSPSASSLTLAFTLADGTPRRVTFARPFPSNTDQAARSAQLLSPVTFSQSQPQWDAALRGPGEAPLFLQSIIEWTNVTALPEIDAVYVQYWTNSDAGVDLAAFNAEARAVIEREAPSVIILDQRMNMGGNYNTTADFMNWLGEALPHDGRLYILTAGTTFSAGISSAARALQSAEGRAIIMGEPVGDTLRFWSEDNLITLPNSGIQIRFNTGYHDLTRVCRWFTDCFWSDMFRPLAVESLDPDIFIPFTSRDYFTGRDPVLERIYELEGAR